LRLGAVAFAPGSPGWRDGAKAGSPPACATLAAPGPRRPCHLVFAGDGDLRAPSRRTRRWVKRAILPLPGEGETLHRFTNEP